MSRQKQEKVTDQEIVEQYKPKVFGIYARNVLEAKASKEKDPSPERLREYDIHSNGTSVKRIIRLLYENDILIYRHTPTINLSMFNKEAPALAKLENQSFQLDTQQVFRGTTVKTTYGNDAFSKDSLSNIGGRKISDLNTSTALWAYFNQDKIYFNKSTKDNNYGYFLFLKNRETEVTRHKLLKILFEEIKHHPTEYLAGFSGTAWVGRVSSMPHIRKHAALEIIYGGYRQVLKAEKEIRKHADHFLAYANMLKDIKIKMRGDKTEQVTSFLKFMISAMLKKAPINLQKFEYKTILENASEFTFENLFPDGLTEKEIKSTLIRINKY